jgi:hypothetical protein
MFSYSAAVVIGIFGNVERGGTCVQAACRFKTEGNNHCHRVITQLQLLIIIIITVAGFYLYIYGSFISF